LAVSAGVKVTLWEEVPALGVVAGVVNAKLPATLAVPPLRVLLDKVCPYVIAPAVGSAPIAGVALSTVTLTVVVTGL
jgi:hypothetical protein